MTKLLLAVLTLTLTGCVSVAYDPATGMVRYDRLGSLQLEDVVLRKRTDGSLDIRLGTTNAQERVTDVFLELVKRIPAAAP